MNSLKETDGRYYQECEVVMVATKNIIENGNQLHLHIKGNLVIPKTSGEAKRLRDYQNYEPQHLYITSNEEIKEGDWLVEGIPSLFPFAVIKATKEDYDRCRENWQYGSCRKIIATTDETLYLTFNNGKTDLKFVLPKPSNSFISKYIEEYNKGNIITNVLVEYLRSSDGHYDKNQIWHWKLLAPKIYSNNTITIKKIKDSYSRKEVEEFIRTVGMLSYQHGLEVMKKGGISREDFSVEDWIKENL